MYLVEDAVHGNGAGADEETKGHEPVLGRDAVQIRGERPGRGVGVVGLDRGAAPAGVAVAVDEHVAVAADDGVHDGVAHKAAQQGAVDLCEEHGARGNFDCRRSH